MERYLLINSIHMAYLQSFEKNGKVGFRDKNQSVIILPIFDETQVSFGTDDDHSYQFGCVCKEGKCGIINEQGDIVIPFDYEEAYPLINDLFAVRKQEKDSTSWCVGVVNSKLETVIPFDYKQISCAGSFIHCFREAKSRRIDSSKLMDWDGAVYDYYDQNEEEWYNTNHSLIYKGKGIAVENSFLIIENDIYLGLLDNAGKQILTCEYDEIHCVSPTRIIVRKTIGDDWRFGVFSEDGIPIIPFDFKFIKSDNGCFFECYQECKSQHRDSDVINNRYEYTEKSVARWFNYNGHFIYEGDGKIVNPIILAVTKGNHWGAINQNGRRIANFAYDKIISIQSNIIVGKGGKIGIITSTGRTIIPPLYSSIECVNCRDNSRNHYGDYNFHNVFDTIHPAVDLEKKRIIYSNGIMKVENADGFEWDSCFVLSDERSAELFTIKDGIIASSNSDKIFQITNSLFVVSRRSKWGVFSLDSQRIVIPCQYDRIQYQGYGIALLCKKDLWGAMSLGVSSQSRGVILPIKYNEIRFLDHKKNLFCVKEGNVFNLMIEYKDGLTLVQMGPSDSQFEYYRPDRLLTSRDGKWGFIGVLYKWSDLVEGYDSIPFKYDTIHLRADGNFNVRIGKEWGVINLEGNEIVSVKYEEAIPETIDNAIVKDHKSRRYGVLSGDGREKVPTIYEYLEIRDDLIYFGYGGNEFYGGDARGCMNLDGDLLVPPVYNCIWSKGDFILAGRDGTLFWGTCHHSGVYDLYTRSGEFIFGGFDAFNKKGDYYLFLLNGDKDSDDRECKKSRWLVLDKNLLSVKRGKDRKRVQFKKGFNVTVREEEKDHRRTYYYNLDVQLLVKERPDFTDKYMLTMDKNRAQAIRLTDGKSTGFYDEIYPLNADLFAVVNENKCGIVSINNKIVLPFEYFAMTVPVNGCSIAFKDIDKNTCSVDLIASSGRTISSSTVIASKSRREILSGLRDGKFRMTPIEGGVGLQSIGLGSASLLDEPFASLIASGSSGKRYNSYDYSPYCLPSSFLIKPDKSFYEEEDDEGCDLGNDRLNWDAMTDGMEGNMPDDFDGDFSFMGY